MSAKETCNTLPPMPRQTRPRMVVMSFRLPEDVREQLDVKAAAQGMNPTEIVRDLVSDWVEDK